MRTRHQYFERPFYLAIALLVLPLVSPAKVPAADTYEVTVERNVPATMRDGIKLLADVYRPKADGKCPVLLVRTP